MKNENYIPLRTTSQYSLLEGAMKIEKIVNKARLAIDRMLEIGRK